jgi:hypothetical protein
MRIRITTTFPAIFDHEGLCLCFFSDERPPKGFCGAVDWRLNGLISCELAAGRITGAPWEDVLIAPSQRLPATKVLLVGMGPFTEISYEHMYQSAYHIAKTMNAILCREYIVSVPSRGRSNLNFSGVAEAMVTGLFDFLSTNRTGDFPALFLRVDESLMQEALAGFGRFQARVNDDVGEDLFEVKISSTVLEGF